MATKSSPHDWKEARRWRAWDLKQGGWAQRAIADALGVTKGAVSQWMSAVETGGVEALRARPRTGRPCELTEAQRQRLPEFLAYGAEAYGFRGGVWTCARVGKVIEQEFGIRYHKAHVSRLLKQLDWTPQKPVERAAQRNEALIESWRSEVWPELKKRPAGSGARWFLSTNPASICCPRLYEPMRRAEKRRSCGSSRLTTICR
jgi:transposase